MTKLIMQFFLLNDTFRLVGHSLHLLDLKCSLNDWKILEDFFKVNTCIKMSYCTCCCQPNPPCLLGGVRFCCLTGVRRQLLPPVI